MGYESRLYIANKRRVPDDTGMQWAETITRYDLSKYPVIANFFAKQPQATCFVYADDGNTKVLEDRYGKPLTEAKPQEVIELLEQAVNDGDKYRRIPPLLAMLKALDPTCWQELVVLHYGY